MQTIIIDHKGTQLGISNRRLRIAVPDAAVQHVPLALIERLIITASVMLESSVATALAAQGASLLITTPRDHERTAVLHAPYGRDAESRFRQCAAACEPEQCLRLARRIIRGKLSMQQRNLHQWQQRHHGDAIRLACSCWRPLRRKAWQAATLEQLRGLEGGAAALYFAAMKECLPDGLQFKGRQRRPPPDPVNAALSLSYTLLHHDAVQILLQQGLDPAIGFLHCAEYSRASLACDIIEPFRPPVDAFVLELFRQRQLREEDFRYNGKACLLGKAGRARYFAAWEAYASGQRRLLAATVRHVKRSWTA